MAKHRAKSKLFEWQKKLQNSDSECAECGRKYYLTVDHIIPVSILQSLNLDNEVYNWEENWQIICGACNKAKGGWLKISNPKTIPLLEEVIRRTKLQIDETHKIKEKVETED